MGGKSCVQDILGQAVNYILGRIRNIQLRRRLVKR